MDSGCAPASPLRNYATWWPAKSRNRPHREVAFVAGLPMTAKDKIDKPAFRARPLDS